MNTFINWWQNLPENFSPVIFQIGSFSLHYYGLMYIIAFAITYGLVTYRIRTESRFSVSSEQAKDLMLYMILGLIIGARIGYVLFYNFSYYLIHPLEIIIPFRFENGIIFTGISGMSFHGGLLGVIASTWMFARKSNLTLYEIADLFTPAIPLGYTFGRLGNFINGELYGRVTRQAIGMHFPQAPGPELRHPSQLYEAFFEGIFLFGLLWGLRRFKQPMGAMLAFYLIGYGTVRFFIEYFRQPDEHLGLIFISLSMGQLLSAAMIGVGILLYLYLNFLKQRV